MIPDSIRTKALLPRAVVPAILKWMDDRQALVLVGSRQVGETSILFLLIQHLLRQQVPSRNAFYFDLVFTIENIQAFNPLVQLLALAIANLVNLNTLTAELGLSRPTLSNDLTILENTFIIKRLPPFFRRKKERSSRCRRCSFLTSG